MMRILFDTNIYGLIVIDRDRKKVVNKIQSREDLIIYGVDLIRKELRDTPKKIRTDGVLLRKDLLSLYNSLVKEHVYGVDTAIEEIAKGYLKAYRELGGIRPEKDLVIDFKIVACATVHGLDIVVSDDEKTMLSENAIRAYRLVNAIIKKGTPNFIDYRKFKRLLI